MRSKKSLSLSLFIVINPEFRNMVTGLGMLHDAAGTDADIPHRFHQFH